MICQDGRQDVEIDDSLRHFYADLTKFLTQNRRQLSKKCTSSTGEKLESELNPILVSNAVSVVILPTRFIESFGGSFWIVRPRLDVGIEIGRLRIEHAGGNPAHTKSDSIDDLLPIYDHCHGLPHPFVVEKRSFVIPNDEGDGGD